MFLRELTRAADEMPESPSFHRSASELRALTRELKFDASGANAEQRTVPVAYSSEAPVRRGYGGGEFWEVLDHSAVDLSRMDGAPLLFNHDTREHIGTVIAHSVGADKVGRSLVKFSRSQRAQEKFQDVQDGILTKSSVGYSLENADCVAEGERDGIPVYKFRNWQPFEVTLTPLPADPSVGVGRSMEKTQTNNISKMSAETIEKTDTKVEVRENKVAANTESLRMSEIRAIGANFNVPQERVIKALAENETLDSFREWVIKDHLKAEPVKGSPEIGMTKKERKRYSISNAINRLSNRESLRGTFEGECSEEAEKKLRRSAPSAGFIVPHDVAGFEDREMAAAMLRVNPALRSVMQRTLYTNNFASAGALVGTELLGGSFIELLRNRTLLAQLGVGSMTGLQGNIAIPRQSGAGTAYWLGEGDAVTASNQTIAQVGATPRRLAAQTGYNKQLLAQSSIDAEAFVRDDLMRVLAIAKDLAGIAGTGGKQPLGILNGPTGGTENQLQTVTFGATATWAKILSFETNVFTQNADQLGTPSFLTNITVRNAWKQNAKIGSTYPVYLTDDNNKTNGYDTNVTNQISTSGTYSNRAIFGVWGQAMFCDWAGYDVVVDPYTQAANNQVLVTINALADFIVRHWPAFCVSTDSGAQ